MKNLSNVDVHDFLSRCRSDKVEGRTTTYEGKSYPIPYSTVKIQDTMIGGLRESEERVALIEKIIEEHSEGRSSYLDIGCNLGVFVRSYEHLFETVEGIDYDWHYIEMCRYLYPDIEDCFILGNLNVKRLADLIAQPKDVITALSMIEYIDNKDAFVGDLYTLTSELCIVEGHSEDNIKGLDKVYDSLLRTQDWEVEKLLVTTDAGFNAPETTKDAGRPLWICKKR